MVAEGNSFISLPRQELWRLWLGQVQLLHDALWDRGASIFLFAPHSILDMGRISHAVTDASGVFWCLHSKLYQSAFCYVVNTWDDWLIKRKDLFWIILSEVSVHDPWPIGHWFCFFEPVVAHHDRSMWWGKTIHLKARNEKKKRKRPGSYKFPFEGMTPIT
jgi:hypothetical protein